MTNSTLIPTEPHQLAGATTECELFWKAVMERDERFDGVIFYGVKTTGVFCRPVCPSRRPRPENVAFFHAPEQARASGFRPCKRCRPDVPGADGASSASRDRPYLLAACRIIEDAEEKFPTLPHLAAEIGLTPDQTRQLFRRTLGVSHKQYADAVRLARFKQAVGAGDSVTDATYGAGFGSSSRLYERAGQRLGMTPGSYGRQGRGEQVSFWTWGSSLGVVLVAATERGLCSVRLGTSPAELEKELREEFAHARVRAAPPNSDQRVEKLRDHISGFTPLAPDLPTDVSATSFQARVWAFLRTIPVGETRTYSEVAAAIGQPKAVRAVAGACASNPVALVVPCHRVLPKGADASRPGGYRWGSERKALLLELERGLRVAGKRSGPNR